MCRAVSEIPRNTRENDQIHSFSSNPEEAPSVPFGLPVGNGPFTTHEPTSIAHLLPSAYKADRLCERRRARMLLEVTNLLDVHLEAARW